MVVTPHTTIGDHDVEIVCITNQNDHTFGPNLFEDRASRLANKTIHCLLLGKQDVCLASLRVKQPKFVKKFLY